VLYESDIDRFARENKPDFEALLHEYADLYPGLEEITTDMTKDDMEERAKGVIGAGPNHEGVSDEVKAEALEDLAGRHPGAVLVPRGQALMRIDHPDLPHEQFELTVFSDLHDEETTGALEFLNETGPVGAAAGRGDPTEQLADESRPDQMEINTTPVEEVPSWAAPGVFDRIVSGRIEVYESAAAAQRSLDQVTQQTRNVLGGEAGNLRMKHEVEAVGEQNGETEYDFVARPKGDFDDPSQVAAWAVLNEDVDGEPPIPERPEERSPDTSNISEEEKARVRRRIQTCLDNPRRFADVTPKSFDERTFFNQLLRCEFRGFTPPRTPDQDLAESMREDIFRIIRELARDSGFEVVGDYVRPRPDQPKKVDFSEGVFEGADRGQVAPDPTQR